MEQEKDQHDASLIAPLSSIASPQTMTLTPFACLKNVQWWRNALLLSLVFARHCVIPACIWLIALGAFLLPSIFIATTFGKTVEIGQLIQALVVYLVTLVTAGSLLFWCFGAWLVRLTAYSAAFTSFSRHELIAGDLDREKVRTAQREALDQVKSKKIFLAKFWSTLTIFLSVPCAVFFVSMMVTACTSAAVLGTSAIKLPTWAVFVTNMFCLASGLATTMPSFVGICVSAKVDSEPVKQAKNVVSVSLKSFAPLTLITAFSVLVSVLISSPHELVQGGPTSSVLMNFSWVSVAQEVWRAISSTVVWTITLAPICEYMRDKQVQNG